MADFDSVPNDMVQIQVDCRDVSVWPSQYLQQGAKLPRGYVDSAQYNPALLLSPVQIAVDSAK